MTRSLLPSRPKNSRRLHAGRRRLRDSARVSASFSPSLPPSPSLSLDRQTRTPAARIRAVPSRAEKKSGQAGNGHTVDEGVGVGGTQGKERRDKRRKLNTGCLAAAAAATAAGLIPALGYMVSFASACHYRA